jgi:carbonic anhydrase/acetyltransferase-like protein (isoleucine patch superfamily)
MALIKTLRGHTPNIADGVFLAENAVIIGEVTLGANASVWYNVVIRGDVHYINIGAETNVQDGAIIHCTYQRAPTTIGNRVTIGHGAIIHGCTIDDSVLVGMGAIILDHAHIPSDVIIAAGSLVLTNQKLESGFLYAGVPAKKVKPLTPEQITGIQTYADHYIMYSRWFIEESTPE